MARLIKHFSNAPFIHTTESGDKVKISMCGLSKKYPLCDGTHHNTLTETDKLCYYDKEANRITSISLDDSEMTEV